MLQSAIQLGSARELTLAGGEGKRMELIPELFWEGAGVGDAVDLGSARSQTRADTIGVRSELVPDLYFVQAGDA